MQQLVPAWTWTQARERAAVLVADDTRSDEQIAAEVGINRVTLHRWRQHPTFQERVAGLVEAYRTEVKRRGIAERQNRVDALNDRWQKMQAVIEARAGAVSEDNPAHDPLGLKNTYREQALASGFQTGLMNVEWAGMFGNKPTFKFDAALLKEMRDVEKQAAQELGQWTTKQEHSGTVTIDVSTLNDDDLDAYLDALRSGGSLAGRPRVREITGAGETTPAGTRGGAGDDAD